MKLRILIGLVLVALIGELIWLSFALSRDYDNALTQAEQQEVQLWQKENQISDLEDELEDLEDDIYGDLNVQIQRLEDEIAMLEGQKGDISGEITALEAELAELGEKLKESEAENEYYLEVYNELKEGLEKVKGYIAGD